MRGTPPSLITTFLALTTGNAIPIREVIEATLTELGLDKPTAKDKGKLMKALMPKVKDKADGALVNRLVGTYLK